jgi:hypothetical protein
MIFVVAIETASAFLLYNWSKTQWDINIADSIILTADIICHYRACSQD